MITVNEGLEALRAIKGEFADFCSVHGNVSEADTRAKVIDRILREVCDWPEPGIVREQHNERGYMDYVLTVQGRKLVTVEAKKEGIPFIFPVDTTAASLKLSGPLLSQASIREAIHQVRGYCDEAGIRYAIATNGYAWIVFRALRDDSPWREGSAVIFKSLDEIIDNFTRFWNLLSYPAILGGSLDTAFGLMTLAPRQLHRVITRLFNSDLPLRRNLYHAQLDPFIRTIFENIADQGAIEILQSCYIYSSSLRIMATDLNLVIEDSIPRFLAAEGTVPANQSEHDAGAFGDAVLQALSGERGELFLLLGGIGSGKTTFIRRYQRTVGEDLLSKTLWFHIDFLRAPLDPLDLESFVWRTVLEEVRSRFRHLALERRRHIKRIFADDIAVLAETGLRDLASKPDEFDSALSPYLEKWQGNLSEYVPRLLKLAVSTRKLGLVIFIDNVDQLSPAYQAQIFLLAQRITRIVNATTIVVLREESYYTVSIQRAFTAYTTRKFHIASPRFRRLIGKRIEYAVNLLSRSPNEIKEIVSTHLEYDREALADFLKIVEHSIFEQNRNIARFIEAICYGNMRLALQMFATFLTSGVTDVDKMLRIYRRDHSYFVAFHEFVKSVMLKDRQYYKEAESPIMNLFDCGAERNASHFTALRILRMVLEHRGEYTSEGQGYVEVGMIVRRFEDVFDDREDVVRTLNRLVTRQLIETNTRSTESIAGASHVRATSAGWYYQRYLVRAFAYLDLVLQDTPLNSLALERELRDAVAEVNNLSDREELKIERMEVRFNRVGRFLSYLADEERREREMFRLTGLRGVLGEEFVGRIAGACERQIKWIRYRLRENRERYADEAIFEQPDEFEPISDEPGEEAGEGEASDRD